MTEFCPKHLRETHSRYLILPFIVNLGLNLLYRLYLCERKAHEPGHEKMCLMSYAHNKGANQSAHPRSLISAFVVRCLDSMLSLDSIAEISRLYLAFVAAQAGLCLAWSETPEYTFCRVMAHIDVL